MLGIDDHDLDTAAHINGRRNESYSHARTEIFGAVVTGWSIVMRAFVLNLGPATDFKAVCIKNAFVALAEISCSLTPSQDCRWP